MSYDIDNPPPELKAKPRHHLALSIGSILAMLLGGTSGREGKRLAAQAYRIPAIPISQHPAPIYRKRGKLKGYQRPETSSMGRRRGTWKGGR